MEKSETITKLNFKNIKFPVNISVITKFKKQNPKTPGINVFTNEGNIIVPGRTSNKTESIHLFFFFIYSLIKNFSRLVNIQVSKNTNKKYFCKRCLNHFCSEKESKNHERYCKNNDTLLVEMPPKKNYLSYKNYQKMFPVPFVTYADFESFTKKKFIIQNQIQNIRIHLTIKNMNLQYIVLMSNQIFEIRLLHL